MLKEVALMRRMIMLLTVAVMMVASAAPAFAVPPNPIEPASPVADVATTLNAGPAVIPTDSYVPPNPILPTYGETVSTVAQLQQDP